VLANAPPPSTTHGKLTTDPDLNRAAPAKLLAIDWSKASASTDADALRLWREIAPRGDDWEAKLEEIPVDSDIAQQLAVALLREGNFHCVPKVAASRCTSSVPVDLEAPPWDATIDDPCLRRLLALWAIDTLDEEDLPAVADALRAIAAIPPPESQLVAAALDTYPEQEQDRRLELLAIAFAAGHRELGNCSGRLGDFDEAHQLAALQQHHIDGVINILPAETHRAAFLGAISDHALDSGARVDAITELASAVESPALPRDLRAALVTATKAADCRVAAAAARVLVAHGERKYAPSRPRARTTAPMMRALCVLASFEAGQRADEPSYLLGYVPAKGLEQVRVTYDAYNDVDTDGDGDPHTERTLVTVPRDEVGLPDVEDRLAAF